MSNVKPLLSWIPACAGMTMPALDPDPGYAVMPDLIRHPEDRQDLYTAIT